jgi:Tfp pilus assembly protein PilO
MTKLRQLWLLTALASVLALAGGYFLLVSPKTSKAAALREETKTQEELNASLRDQIQMLNRQKKDLPRQQAELERFATKIPNNPALPALVRALSDAADNAGIELVSITPSEPTPVGASTAAGTTAADPAAPVSAAAPASATRLPLAAIPVNVKVNGTYSEVSQWMSEIERLPRAFLVSGFTLELAPAKTGADANAAPSDELTLQMQGLMYMTIKAPTAPRVAQPAATTVVK